MSVKLCEMRSLKRVGVGGVVLALTVLLCGLMAAAAAPSNCSLYSSTDTDQYWDAVAKCPACSAEGGCGYCLSTLQCLPGVDGSGPNDGSSCPNWAFDSKSCPVVPNCKDYTDCGGKCGVCASF
jgi:hypothetical protein